MSPREPQDVSASPGPPRASGDEPLVGYYASPEGMSAPRERG